MRIRRTMLACALTTLAASDDEIQHLADRVLATLVGGRIVYRADDLPLV